MLSLSLTSFLNSVAEQPHTVDFIPHRCLRKRLNTNNCSLCLDSCSSGALSLRGREIVLDMTCCTGCMTCVSVCPQDALTSKVDTDGLLASLAEKTSVQISCGRQKPFHSDEIIIPCLGIFSKHLIAAMGLSNRGSIIFNLSGCNECPNHHASEIFKQNYYDVIEALPEILNSNFSIAKNSNGLEQQEVDRRAFLTDLKKTFSKASKSYLSFEVKPIELEPIPSRRVPYKTTLVRRLINGLAVDSRERILSLLGNTLSVNDECTGCPLCKGICPTGAIKIERSEQGKKLIVEMLDCSGCGLCVEFCKSRSLTLN